MRFGPFCSSSGLGLQFHTFLSSTLTSWAPLGVNLELLDACWAQLGASWAQLGASWAPLCALYICLCSSPWPLERLFVICTPVCTALPGLLSASLCHVHPSVLFVLIYYLTCELLFELTQQLPVRTKLHLNFHNSFRFQQHIVAFSTSSSMDIDGSTLVFEKFSFFE